MATRFYIHNNWFPPVSFTRDPIWDTAAAGVRRMLPQRNGFEQGNLSQIENTATADQDVLVGQFISPPLLAQTITGTFHGAAMVRESSTNANMRSQVVVRVMAPDGTVRGTLIAADTSALSNEWVVSGSAWRSSRFPVGSSGTTVTSVAALAGDYIVIEAGARAHNTSATAFSATIRVGNGQSNTDTPSNETDTNGFNNAWFEFSQNLTFAAEHEIFDDIADAVDALPDPLTERMFRESDFSTFTEEADDPDEMLTFYPGAVTGWIRLDAPSGEPAVLSILPPGGGHESWPTGWIYDEVPTSSSLGVYFDYNDDAETELLIPAGEFRYIGLNCDITWPGMVDDVFLIVRRLDGGAPTGDIKDDIADAVDVFPASEGTETESETTNLAYFTTEPDDPTDITDYTDNPHGYTGWLKLVVPTTALVTISVLPASQPGDLIFYLYDEVPTASSVAIHSDDSDDPEPGVDWPYLPEITLTAGTYYLMVGPWEGADWSPFEGGYVGVKVRWELAPVSEDFSADAIIQKTITAPDWIHVQPTLVDSVAVTTDDSVSLNLTIPGTAEEGDIFLVQASVDYEGVSQTVSMSLLEGSVASGNTLTALGTSIAATNNHALQSRWCNWNGLGDTIRVASTNSTAKAVVLSIWRNAGIPVLRTSTNATPVILTSKTNNAFGVLASDPNIDKVVTIVNAWAGGSGATTWTPGTPVVEIEDVTATSSANLMVGYWTTNFDSFVEPTFATPSLAEFTLIHTITVVPLTLNLTLRAYIIPGFSMDAYIRAVTHTTHPRTGPHTGVHPSTAVVTSALLGSLPAGTDLNTVIADIDQRLTDLENQT